MTERPDGAPIDWHRFGTPCLKRANRDAPCLFCGGCTTCCGCKEAMKGKYGPLPCEVAKAKAWKCSKCGVEPEFPAGHLMAGCGGRKDA